MSAMSVSLPWYSTEEDYVAILEMVPASESASALPYREFISYLETLESGVALGGQLPMRIEITPGAIKAWCENNNTPVCRKAIADYAHMQMIERLDSRNN
jgi:hypothetical protein